MKRKYFIPINENNYISSRADIDFISFRHITENPNDSIIKITFKDDYARNHSLSSRIKDFVISNSDEQIRVEQFHEFVSLFYNPSINAIKAYKNTYFLI
jgi:hypothetical protein